MISYKGTRANSFFKTKIQQELDKVLAITNYDDLRRYQAHVEQHFANYIGTTHAHFVNSGTRACLLALYLCGVEKGDEVIVPVISFPSVVLGILSRGATPVSVDVKKDFTIDPKNIEEAITPKTKVVMPTHLFGHLCDMKAILKLCYAHDIKIIEDVCQAHGSRYRGKRAGSFGDVSFFSFDPHKAIAGLGGGGVVFNNKAFKQTIGEVTNYEWEGDWLQYAGGAAKMSFADMAVLKVKLQFAKIIEQTLIKRKQLYQESLAKTKEVELIRDDNGSESIRPFYAAHVQEREHLLGALHAKGIETRKLYTPLHKRTTLAHLSFRESYPIAEACYQSGIILPSFAMITEKEVNSVCGCIKDFYASQG